MNALRVAYVLNVFPKLSETFIAHELAELRRRDIPLRVMSLRRPNETLRHELIAKSGLDALTSYDPGDFLRKLREFRPHLLHAHFATEPAGAARALAAELAVPFTFTAHGYDIRRKPPADFGQRAAAARRVVTVSQANARYIHQAFGVPLEHLRVIPCGVDTEVFRPSAGSNTEPVEPVLPLLVCVARLVKVKNLGLLLRACGLLRDRGIRFRTVCIGEGPMRAELETLQRELRLENAFEFVGALEHRDVLRWWQRASIALLSSQDEGMPVCLMEAAACGLPAVATAVGGVPEVIEHEVTGLITPAGDVVGFANALQTLLADRARASVMGAAARRRAQASFTLARQVDDLLALWREILP
jgi:glycosyltransferase involved in cell wall biosynthesis